jgi:hypothetical protein
MHRFVYIYFRMCRFGVYFRMLSYVALSCGVPFVVSNLATPSQANHKTTARQDKTKQPQDKKRQTRQGKARQDTIRHDTTRQDKTRQDKTKQP